MARFRISPLFLTIFLLFFLYSFLSLGKIKTTSKTTYPTLGYDKFLCLENDGSINEGKSIPFEALEIAKTIDGVPEMSSFSNSDVVFVTYASENHYMESRNAVHNTRLHTNATIVYYDLGLKREHESYRKYPAFWVIDASAKLFNGSNLLKFYEKVRNGEVEPFSAEHPEGHTIARMTTPAMFDYLPLSLNERNSGMVQANTMFVTRSPVAKEIVRWNLLCALVEDCIAPEGASVDCTRERPSCHRYDQSSLSIIMCASRLRRGLLCLSRTATSGAFSDVLGVARDIEYRGQLPTC